MGPSEYLRREFIARDDNTSSMTPGPGALRTREGSGDAHRERPPQGTLDRAIRSGRAREPRGVGKGTLVSLVSISVLLIVATGLLAAGGVEASAGQTLLPDATAAFGTHPVSPSAGSAGPALSVVGNLTVGSRPLAPAYDPVNGYVYVANGFSNNVTVVQGLATIGTVPVGTGPAYMAVDLLNGYLYVANNAQADGNNTSSVVSVINGTSLVGSAPVGPCPQGAAFDPADGFVYVTLCGQSIAVINGTTVVGTVTLPGDTCPSGAQYDPSDGDVFVADPCTNSLYLVNGTSLVGAVAVGISPYWVTYDPANGLLYVPCQGSHPAVYVVDNTTVVASVGVGLNPGSATFDSGNGLVYVPDQGLNLSQGKENFSLINGTTRVATINVGAYPASQPAFSAQYANGTGYVFTTSFDSLVAVAGKAVVENLSVPGAPVGGAFDPQNQYLYVSLLAESGLNGTGSLAVVACEACLGVTLEENGAQAGSAWGVAASNSSTWFAESASAPAPDPITLHLVPGTYSLQVRASEGTTVRVVSQNAVYLERTGTVQVGGSPGSGRVPGPPAVGLSAWVAYPGAAGAAAVAAVAAVAVRSHRQRRDGKKLVERMHRAVDEDPDSVARILR